MTSILFLLLLVNHDFEYEVNGKKYSNKDQGPLKVEVTTDGSNYRTTFTNTTRDTLRLSNVLPFGRDPEYPYITGLGNHPLSRTHLFLPGRQPVNIIVPDNAWELGWSIRPGTVGLSRRDVSSIAKGLRRRFETVLYPGGKVTYDFYIEQFNGSWQDAVTLTFQTKKTVRQVFVRQHALSAGGPSMDPSCVCRTPHHGVGQRVSQTCRLRKAWQGSLWWRRCDLPLADLAHAGYRPAKSVRHVS